MGKAALARIAPPETTIGRPTATARRLVEASVSPNTRRCADPGQRAGALDDIAQDGVDCRGSR